MRNKLKTQTLFITILLLALFIHVSAENNVWLGPINSSDEAEARALEFAGFNKLQDMRPAKADYIQTKMLIDSTTPNMKEIINGRAMWNVQFGAVSLDYFTDDSTNKYNLEVMIDSTTGQLLKIIASRASGDSSSDSIKLEDSVKEPDLRPGLQCTSLPSEPPRHSFLEILKPDGRTKIIKAGKYAAYYVQCSFLNGEEHSYWRLVLYRGHDLFMPMSFPTKDGQTYKPPQRPLINVMAIDDLTCSAVLVGGVKERIEKGKND